MEIFSFLRQTKFIFLMLLLFSNISLCYALIPEHPPIIGQVVWTKGTLKAALPNAAARVLARRSEVYEHDTLTTDPTSTGEVVFTDNSELSLREDSSIKIDEYRHSKGAAKSKDTFVASVAKGGFRTITGAISKNNPGGYKATTPVATIGVSGTDYSVYFDPIKKSMEAKLDKGAISISNPQGKVTLQRCTSTDNTANCANSIYAEVKGSNVAPKTVSQQPAVFTVEPPIIDTTFPTPSTTGPSGSFCVS